MALHIVPDWDDLDDFLAEALPEDLELVPDPETIDEELAGRMLRRAALIKAEGQRIVARAEAESARIKEWHDERMAVLENQLAWVDRSLEGFMRRVNVEDPKVKTVNLPNGKLSLRSARTRVEVNAEIFVPWAQEKAPELLRIKYEADKTALGKLQAVATEIEGVDQVLCEVLDHPVDVPVPGVAKVTPTESTFGYETTVKA